MAVVFGFMYNAENHVDTISKTPAVTIQVDAFQWGWRFVYPNGHQEVGTVANELNINSNADLPTLYMPADESVQLHLVTEDVIHTFYVPAFLFQRDMIPGINNTVQFNVNKTGSSRASATTSAASTTPTCASRSTCCRPPVPTLRQLVRVASPVLDRDRRRPRAVTRHPAPLRPGEVVSRDLDGRAAQGHHDP